MSLRLFLQTVACFRLESITILTKQAIAEGMLNEGTISETDLCLRAGISAGSGSSRSWDRLTSSVSRSNT